VDRATSQQNNSACAGAQKASIDSSGLQSEWACPQCFGACGVAQGICQPENEIQGLVMKMLFPQGGWQHLEQSTICKGEVAL
jgi:hypothetical protein